MSEATIKCPKCTNKMEKVEHQSVIVERCTFCKGIWFDSSEEDKLSSLKAADKIDTGDENTGKQWNEDIEINCPKCSYPLVSKCDLNQSHISYESCPKCHGLFFDAGELKDYQENTVMEYLTSIFG